MKYHFKVHKEGKGYWAECLELEGCQTQADKISELEKNMKDALNLYLNEELDTKLVFPLPKKKANGANIRVVSADPRVALAVHLRYLRKKRNLTQKKIAELLGLAGIYSYQRLESPKTANPEWLTLVRIKKLFPELNLDDIAS